MRQRAAAAATVTWNSGKWYGFPQKPFAVDFIPRDDCDAAASMIDDEDVHPAYVVPSVFDKRVAPAVAAAVAEVAISEGVVREPTAVSD